ncbi:MAG TPA: ABC transporter permease [Gemmatimonadaceae bacterium]|nr:ABC transporter permease [Gemmatimonadaceae bacterium]
MEALIRDLRHAVRSLRRTLGFATTAVLILGLGIGMATAVFTVYHSVLLRRLPMSDQNRLVVLWGTGRGSIEQLPLPYPSYVELRDGSRTLRAVAGYDYETGSALPMHYGGTTLSIHPRLVTGNFFQTLGTQPFLGRLLRPGDDVPGAASVLVLSYATWQRAFRGDRNVIGRRLIFSGESVGPTIVGVAAPGLDFPAGTDAWLPLLPFEPLAASDSAGVGVEVVGRLAPEATGAQARSEFLGVLHRSRAGRQDVMRQFGAAVHPLPELLLGDVRPALVALAASVALLLIIACTNVGNLLLVRAAGRRQEMAIRRALGAGYAHVVRQFLAESVVLGLLGGVLGLLLATAFVRAFLAFAPTEIPRLDTIHPGVGSTVIAVGVTLVSTVLFGLTPALWSARGDLASPLRAGTRGGGSGRSARMARNALVGWQVALAVVVLAGAGLVTRSLERLQHLDLGYRPQGMAVADLDWPWSTYPTAEQSRDPMERIVEHVEALPGVIAATPVHRPPFAGSIAFPGVFMTEGESPTDPRAHSYINVELAGPDYFRTFGLPILRGRAFTAADREGAPLVVIVSEATAHLYWPGENPIGKRLRYPGPTGPKLNDWRTVVGVVPDTRYRTFRAPAPTLYHPYRQFPVFVTGLAVRTVGPPDVMLPAIRRTIAQVEPTVGVFRFSSMDDLLNASLAQPRLDTLLLSGFGLTALLLAAIGLYAITATAVRQQTHELGVRIALGATSSRIRRLVLGQVFWVMAIGTAVGLVAALAASGLLRSMLFEVSPTDPLTLTGVCLLLLIVSLVAAYLPARRATLIDPVQALRPE